MEGVGEVEILETGSIEGAVDLPGTEVLEDIKDALRTLIENIKEIPVLIWDLITEKIKSAINWFFDGLNGMLERIDQSIELMGRGLGTESGMAYQTVNLLIGSLLFAGMVLLIRVYVLVLDLIPII